MWICLNNAFLSVVQPRPNDLPPGCKGADVLLVRARVHSHIEAVFPGATVVTTPSRDYLFRAFIPRDQVADVLAQQVMNLSYGNFKNSVQNHSLHEAYAGFWSIMYRLQGSLNKPANSRTRGKFL